MDASKSRTITHAEWTAEAKALYGDNAMEWRFVCPVCEHVAAVKDWREADAPEGAIAFSCVGRYVGGKVRNAFEGTGKGPCNYAGGGLFRLNPVIVTGGPGADHHVFEFADRLSTQEGGR